MQVFLAAGKPGSQLFLAADVPEQRTPQQHLAEVRRIFLPAADENGMFLAVVILPWKVGESRLCGSVVEIPPL